MANTTTNLRVIFGDGTLGVAGPACHYIFSYERGGLESLVQHGKEWLYRTPMPTFWRATTDNDRGNGFSQDSAMWLGADLFSHCVAVAINVDDQDLGWPIAPETNRFSNHEWAEKVQIAFTYQTTTVPKTNVTVTYQVFNDGHLGVTVHYDGQQDCRSYQHLDCGLSCRRRPSDSTIPDYLVRRIRIGWLARLLGLTTWWAFR